MSDINEVRARAEELASALEKLDAPQDAATIRALLDDHARLRDKVTALHWCAWDRDECTVTLAFESEQQVIEFIGQHPARGRVQTPPAAAPAIDLEQFRESVEAEHELAMCEWRGDQISDEQASVAHVKRDRLLALIDGSKNNNLPHVGDINVVVSQPSTGEGQANVRSSSEHSEPSLIDRQAAQRPLIARQLAEWHEDDGPAMWWAWCGSDWAGEPAWCGTPNDSDWPGYHTHWTPHPAWPMQPSKGEPLWCLHILGPDDVHAAPSKEHAERAAERFNEIHGPVAASAGVMCRAVAAPWPHSPEAHASLVGAFETDCLRPSKGEGE